MKSIPNHINEIKDTKNYIHSIERPQGINVLYLCGGMGMFAEALKGSAIDIANSFDVEIDPTSRAIARANHKIDHDSLPQDLWQVDESHIDSIVRKHGNVDLVIASTPCQGLSAANDTGTGLQDHRSSLFYKAMDIVEGLRRRNQSTKFIVENVDFRTSHPEDYAKVCKKLGTPEFIDARTSSGANRKRLFWHNLGKEQQRHREGDKPIDANTLLDGDAVLQNGATTAPCIMASWACKHRDCQGSNKGSEVCSDPHNHTKWQHMRTHAPVTVMQGAEPRSLRPGEAERLMGLPAGYSRTAKSTSGSEATVADLHRLQRIGGGIDIRSTRTLMRRLQEAVSTPPATKESTEIHIGDPQQGVAALVQAHTGWNVTNIAKWLTAGPLPSGDTADERTWHATWHMSGADDLVRCSIQGFPLRYEGDRTRDVEQDNGRMCQENPDITATELEKEVTAGRIAGPYKKPPLPGFRSSPRGLKEEPTKFRPLTFANQPHGDSVNDGIPKMDHIQLARAQDIERKINATYRRTGQVWMAKADIKMAYRTMPVRPEDWHLQGIKWDGQYYIDMRMSFGNRASVDQWLRFSDALAWALLRWDVHALHYVDDFIFIGGSQEECDEQVRKFKHICREWGVILKDQEDCGPAQKLTALGVEYDLVNMRRRITPTRVAQLAEMLEEAKTSQKREHWEKLTGILWYVIKCVPLGAPHLQPITEATLRARKQKKPVITTEASRSAIAWWSAFINEIKKQNNDGEWHGESIIPTGHAVATTAMGDAGSEWGMGGHDGRSYFKAKWSPELWEQVQREKSTSSLHMEALQLLVMARVMGPTWEHKRVMIELDSLGLVQACKRGRHKHTGINAVLRELAMIQIRHHITLNTTWVRRNQNEAADALSKDDMPRFWKNIRGDRTQIMLRPEHMRVPAWSKTGGMRRTTAERARWDERPTKQIAPAIRTNRSTTTDDIREMVDRAVTAHDRGSDPLHKTRSGVKHYLRFCQRTGRDHNVAPAHKQMAANTIAWMADAVQTYWDPTTKKLKTNLSTSSIQPYLCHIDQWYAIVTDTPRGLLQKNADVGRHRRLITAQYKSARRQVHGITYEGLERLVTASRRTRGPAATLLPAAYTLAWYALLRPTEYMLTPLHNTFDHTRHLRAGDITFWSDERQLHNYDDGVPNRMTVNVKQSKTDSARLGARMMVGETGTLNCPVKCMWTYMRQARPPPLGPLFPGLQYTTMLKMTRHFIGAESELYGMHSFRVGGAQAMALAGRSAAYIMSRGRWKHVESVCRYVEAPDDTKASDSRAMAMTKRQREHEVTIGRGQRAHYQSEGERLLPRGL